MDEERIPIHARIPVRQTVVPCDQGQTLTFAIWKLVGPLAAGGHTERRELVVTIDAELDRDGERRKRKLIRTLDAETVKRISASLEPFFEFCEYNGRGWKENAEFSMQITAELTIGIVNSRPARVFLDVKTSTGTARLQTEDTHLPQHFTFSPP